MSDLATDQDAAQREWEQTRAALAEAVDERDRAEIRVQQLGEALRRLFDATHAYLNTGSDPGGRAVRPLQEALADAYEAVRLDRF